MQTKTQLANELWPLLLPRISLLLAGTGAGSGGGVGSVPAHALTNHTGPLADAQAPQFLLRNGTRPLTGSLAVDDGITIDGVDISTHAADPDAHHAKQHLLANASGLGSDHTVSGAVAGWVLRATASNAARMAQLLVTDLGATGANWSVVSLTAANTVGLRTPASDVSAAVEALLKSNAAGGIALAGLKIGTGDGAMIFSGLDDITAAPDIQFNLNGFLAAETSLYIALDSDNNLASGAALIVGHNSATTTGFQELFRFDDLGAAIISGKVQVPLLDTATGQLTLQPAGDIILDPQGNDVLPANNYQVNLGAINRKYLTLWAAELWVETLVAQNTIATIGGRILVGPTTTLTRDLGAAVGDTTVYVKHNQMSSGDRVYMEANGAVEFMAIASAPTTITAGVEYSYTVTRNLDGSGRNQWYSGDALFNTGQVGNGFIDLYSLSGIPRNGQSGQRAGPAIVGNVRVGTIYNNFRERWAIGNLNALYDYGNNEYGAAFGDPTAAWVGMDAVNGFRVMAGAAKRAQLDIDGNFNIYNSAAVPVITLDNAGASYFAGIMTIGTGGEIRQGTGTLGSSYTGLRLWRDGNVGRIGGYNANVLQWYAGTDGKLYAGAGNVVIDVVGLKITPGAYGWSDISSPIDVVWQSGATRYGSIGGGVMDAFGNAAGVNIRAYALVSSSGMVRLSSYNTAGALVGSAFFQGTTFTAPNLSADSISLSTIYGANAVQLLNGSVAQGLLAGYLLASNDYSHVSRVPTNGIYSLGSISTSGGISSYAADLYIARAGTSKLGLFTWGTYAYGSLTLDDILALAAVQSSEPATPTSGAKLYLINRSGVIRLEAKFANGIVKVVANNT